MDLTIAYGLLELDEAITNTEEYIFPALSFSQDGSYSLSNSSGLELAGVSTGNPLSAIHIVTISKEILNSNNCYGDRQLCLITLSVYPNPNVEYSNQYLQTGVGYYSGNSYWYNNYDQVVVNSVMRIQDGYNIIYFSYQLGDSDSYGIRVKPVSNCRPVLQLESDNYAVDHYGDVQIGQIMPRQEQINYRVVLSQYCLFEIVLTDQPFYATLFPNVRV